MFSLFSDSPVMMYGGLAVIAFVFWVLIAMLFRVVVPTNEVHIVQSKTSTVSYGKD